MKANRLHARKDQLEGRNEGYPRQRRQGRNERAAVHVLLQLDGIKQKTLENAWFIEGFETTLDGPELFSGGDAGIRTLDAGLSPHASLAGKCLRPLGHVSTPQRSNYRTL